MHPAAPPKSGGGGVRRGRRVALMAGIVLAAALAAGAGAFLAGIEVSGEFLRAPLERWLTAAFRMPTRIEGPLTLQTGLSPTLSADALVLADPSGPAGATFARGTRPSARIDLVALVRGEVALDEVMGEQLELTLIRRADGRVNWAPIFTTYAGKSKPSVSFGGIARLRIGSVTGSYRREGAVPVPFAIAKFDGALPLHAQTAARGSLQVAGQPAEFDLRSAALVDLTAVAAFPVQGTLHWAGLRAAIDGALARDGSRFGAGVRASADDASAPLAALGVAANQPGPLDLRMHLSLSAAEAAVRDLALTLGNSTVAGSASIAWTTPFWRVTADLTGERIDLAPFPLAAALPRDKSTAAVLVDLLERTAAGVDAEVRLAATELAGLPVAVRELRFEGRSRDRVVGAQAGAVVSGTRVEVHLDYDARKPRRSLAARVEGGGASTADLPGKARPRELSGSVAGIRGQLRAEGEDARALVASVQANLDARDLRWTLDLNRGPLSGRFDLVRISVQGTKASSVEVTGKLGDAACSLKVAGGALAPLLDGEPWPLQIGGTCPGARFSATGRLALAQRKFVGELSFDASADRVGPLAEVLGVPSALPRPLAARGTLVLDEQLARARLAALRLGRSTGSGEIALPLGTDGAPRVQLALTTLDLNELGALVPPGAARISGSAREVARKDIRLPDLEFEVTADRVAVADTTLRRLQFAGKMGSQKLPPAPLRFEWEGVPVNGRFGADLSGAAPSIQFDVSAQDADLRAMLAHLGYADVRLRAGSLSLQARATGATLDKLLAAATVNAALERGRLDLPRRTPPRQSVRSEFSATLAAAPGRPTTLAARGAMAGEPIDLAVEMPSLADFARADAAIPVTARATLGDAHLEAVGKVTRNGAWEGRLQLSGEQLDRLGRVIGMPLPEVGPYAASADVAVSGEAVRADGVAASLGRSRALGDLRVERRRGRPLYFAALRMPVLHLEDFGADRWLGGSARSGSGEKTESPIARRVEVEIERGLDLLRGADLDATLDIEALFSAGDRFASGRLRATASAGALRVQLQDVRGASGGLDADLRVDACVAPPKFALRAQARDLEYAALARVVDPASTAAGKIDLVVDLSAQGPPGRLRPALAGTVDIAIYPRGLHSDGLAFWGSGLLNSIVGQLDPESRRSIECAVTSLDVDSGVARSTAFFADTKRVRIVGEFELDLTSSALSGRIRPLSKEPQLMTFAPTMLLTGTFDSPRVTSAPENVVTVPLRLATSVAGFAFDWLNAKDKSREGAAGCREAFERIRQGRAGAAGTSPQ